MMRERVLIPKRPRSVHYHRPGCGNIDERAAAELARQDAEALGYRPHVCVGRPERRQDPDDAGGREVPA